MTKLKLAVITDGPFVPRFMLAAIDAIGGCDEISVYACSNTTSKRRPWKHGLYYALNLLTVRNPQSRGVPLASGRKRIARSVEFASDYEGAWQTIPDAILDDLRRADFDVVLKVGMGLLRVPPPEILPAPILSYHHGDPSFYCGRPAGFWEMLNGAPVLGQIVQRLSNKLDRGTILAFAETKVHPYSYRATLIEAYRHSPLLINEAIRNVVAGRAIEKAASGRNYRLPSNAIVASFVLRMIVQFIKRLGYGGFIEKKWNVSLAQTSRSAISLLKKSGAFPNPGTWRTLEPHRRYLFFADPFFTEDPPGLLVEALNRTTALGEIVLIEGSRQRQISATHEHFSYPCTVLIEGRQVIIPETAVSSAAMAYTLNNGMMSPMHPLTIDVDDGLIDPTLHVHDDRVYLFANLLSVGPHALFLWSASSLDSDFERHPLSPVLVSPVGARMAGSLFWSDQRIVRLGQDSSGEYGDGLIAFEVEELSPLSYSERKIGALRFTDRRGPHTMNFRGGELVFDWYRSTFTPFAGIRRLMARRNAARRSRSNA